MGSDKSKDKDAYDNETPQHTVRLDGYEIGKYLVTVAEYALFVEATHCAAPKSRWNILYWEEQQDLPDHPVVNVNWYDAQAYVRWLSAVMGEQWRLPNIVLQTMR